MAATFTPADDCPICSSLVTIIPLLNAETFRSLLQLLLLQDT